MNFRNPLALAAYGFAASVVIGGAIGLATSKPETYSSRTYGTVPAHECVVERASRCGMYASGDGRVLELSRAYKAPKTYLVESSITGRLTTRRVPADPTVLSESQVQVALISRKVLRHEAGREGIVDGAAIGAMVGIGIVILLGALTALGVIARYGRPAGAVVGRGLVAGLARLVPFGRSVDGARVSLADTVKLRAEVYRSELLARKYAAEEELARRAAEAARKEDEA
ncbi:MAG: hypothetical protein ACU0DK_08915 [Pseudooceanicola sp.]